MRIVRWWIKANPVLTLQLHRELKRFCIVQIFRFFVKFFSHATWYVNRYASVVLVVCRGSFWMCEEVCMWGLYIFFIMWIKWMYSACDLKCRYCMWGRAALKQNRGLSEHIVRHRTTISYIDKIFLVWNSTKIFICRILGVSRPAEFIAQC